MKYPFKRILVTGGCGFIGSAYIDVICSKFSDIEILNIDNLSYAVSKKTIRELDNFSNYKLKNINISNYKKIYKEISEFKPDLIINFAAESHVDNSIKNSKPFIDTNIIGTFNLLEGLRNAEVNCLFHHISTDEVFGDLNSDDKPFTELNRYLPSSPYSASKAASDHLVRSWSRTYGIDYLITNCSNNFGPRQHFEKLIPKIINNSVNDEPIPVYGDGKNIRDWIYVYDHVDMLIKLHASGAKCDEFNIGTNNEMTNIELIKVITNILKNDFGIKAHMSFIDDRKGHDRRYAIDNKKLLKHLNITNKSFNNIDSFKSTVSWYVENKNWW